MGKSIPLFFLLFILILFSFTSCSQTQLIEISRGEMTPEIPAGEVFIEGEVNVPGIYPLKKGDTVEALLESAGGLQTGGSDIYCRIYFESGLMPANEQKIDLNRAPRWLLEALPGIGTVTAQNIVSYRADNGPFYHVKELMNVAGIGEATFKGLADKITVMDAGG